MPRYDLDLMGVYVADEAAHTDEQNEELVREALPQFIALARAAVAWRRRKITSGRELLRLEDELRDAAEPFLSPSMQRKLECPTCRDGGHKSGRKEKCIGCQAEIDYWSCAPGYCIACAHHPAWVPAFPKEAR